jgi:hypothetical protein
METIEETELLRAMGRIVGRIELDRDHARLATAPIPVVLDHGIHEDVVEQPQVLRLEVVLEARERRLRSQIGSGDRIPPEEQLEEWIAPEPGGVIAVLVPGRQAVDALLKQRQEVVLDSRWVPAVRQVRQDPLRQPEPQVGCPKQQQTRVRGQRRLVELGQDRPGEKLWKEETLCRRIRSQEKLLRAEKPCFQGLSSTRRLSCLQLRE